jgi:arylsulfatase A-like enzyme
MKRSIFTAVLLLPHLLCPATAGELPPSAKPNILWLTTEDHGPHLGCYGDPDAVTPHLDAFAKQALLYTRASSTAPICAPSRTTLATGVYGTSLGAHHMRSAVAVPAWLELIPQLLRKEGYYCTNNGKTDYNLVGDGKGTWSVSSNRAHYRNRPEGKPFFAVFNNTTPHESQIRNDNPQPLHDPAKVSIPPYLPDIPATRRDWAQYHDRITQMDKWFGQQLAELEKAGLAGDTIVFFFSDHGSGMPRSKRYAGWSGLHVPLLVRIPEKFRHLRPADYQAGGKTDRLVGFVDFAPTLLSLAGQQARPWHQGRAFLGAHIAPAPEYSFGFVGRADERPDESRSVTDGRYLYIRNLMPHVPLLKGLGYQMQTPTTRRWKELFDAGKLNAVQSFAWTAPRPTEELYDLAQDPHETRNLAADRPELSGNLRVALNQHLIASKDLGLLPESTMHALSRQHNLTPGDFARSAHFDPAALVPPATAATPADCLPLRRDDTQILAAQLRALVVHAPEVLEKQPSLRTELETLLGHESAEIRAGAAELLSRHPATRDRAVVALVSLADPAATDPFAALHALDALSRLDTLDAAHVETLRKTHTKPADRWPDRVRRYAGDLNSIVVRQFTSPIPK